MQYQQICTKVGHPLAGRASDRDVSRQAEVVLRRPELASMLDALPNPVVILNQHRQIVFANRIMRELIGVTDPHEILGLRPGEALGCREFASGEDGCGTARFCAKCGARNAILGAVNGCPATDECHIQTIHGNDFELRVHASPFQLDDEKLILFSVTDISYEIRKKALERVFFHDILNTAGNILGCAEVLDDVEDADERREFAFALQRQAHQLLDQIQAQRDLTRAESGDLTPKFECLAAHELLEQVLEGVRHHEVARDRKINLIPAQMPCVVHTDGTLASRVVGNMTKNALEATAPGGTVSVVCREAPGAAWIGVHNDAVIPADVQDEIFRRSYSTKGAGRGLGTYSMRLLAERYLHGRVWFESDSRQGTWFWLALPRPDADLAHAG